MKFSKWLALLTSLVMLLTLASSAVAERPGLEAPRAGEVVIDGDLSEWDMTKTLKVVEQSQITDQLEHWDGEDDCAMEVAVMWDENYLYFAVIISDADPFVYREGFPLDELDAIIFFLSTNPDADPARTEYEATDWRWTISVENYYGDWFNYIDRSMLADDKGYMTIGEWGDSNLFNGDCWDSDEAEAMVADLVAACEAAGVSYEAAFTETQLEKDENGEVVTYEGAIYEIRLPLAFLSNENIPVLTPAAGMTVGFDFSILDVDLPCPGIHSLRLQYSAELTATGGRTPDMHDADNNPSLWTTLTFVD